MPATRCQRLFPFQMFAQVVTYVLSNLLEFSGL